MDQGLISTASPIGRALLNKEEGDEVSVTTPNGSKRFEIVGCSPSTTKTGRTARCLSDRVRRRRLTDRRSTFPSLLLVLTPDAPDRQYSTRLRTALVLTGSGTAGAYQAGVLRALHEAGIRIDLVAGRGIGATGAMFSAMDGGTRLWDENGIWRSPGARPYYRWRRTLRSPGGPSPRRRNARACRSRARRRGRSSRCRHAPDVHRARPRGRERRRPTYAAGRGMFAPAALPTIVPRLAVVAALVALGAALLAIVRADGGKAARRRASLRPGGPRARRSAGGRRADVATCSASSGI